MLTESLNSDHRLRLMLQLCFSDLQTVVLKQLYIKGSDLLMSDINTEYLVFSFSICLPYISILHEEPQVSYAAGRTLQCPKSI